MIALGQELDRNQKEYANIITEEMGKPITQAIQEIKKCVDLCYYYAEHAQEMSLQKKFKLNIIKVMFQQTLRNHLCHYALELSFLAGVKSDDT